MRKSARLFPALALVLSLSTLPPAFAQDMRWEVLAPSERIIVDRLAADFYEETLRRAQSHAIEQRTSQLYSGAHPPEQARFRDERRHTWRQMTPQQREALRGVKNPAYRNLTEAQKAPFRRHALDQLGAAGALDSSALVSALNRDI